MFTSFSSVDQNVDVEPYFRSIDHGRPGLSAPAEMDASRVAPNHSRDCGAQTISFGERVKQANGLLHHLTWKGRTRNSPSPPLSILMNITKIVLPLCSLLIVLYRARHKTLAVASIATYLSRVGGVQSSSTTGRTQGLALEYQSMFLVSSRRRASEPFHKF